MSNRLTRLSLPLAVGGIVLALTMIGVLEWLLHEDFAAWLHIPLTFVVLNLMAGGAAVTGVSLVEYRERSRRRGEQAQ